MNFWKILNWIFDEASCEPLYGFLCVHLYQPLFPTDQLSQNCNLGDTTWWRQFSALSMLVTVFVSLKWVTQYSGEMVMLHNLCITYAYSKWLNLDNYLTMKLKSPICKNLRNDWITNLNRLQRMRPQTKININRKETRIFGAVYERVYDEISWILRNNDFSYFKAFKVLKNLRFWEFSENSVRSQKFKNQEAWKVKAGNNSISNHFWFLSFSKDFCLLTWQVQWISRPVQPHFSSGSLLKLPLIFV